MSILDKLVEAVAGKAVGGDNPVGKIMDLVTGNDNNQQQQPNVRPASEDPYGDPADGAGPQGQVLPASQDPYGDPADTYNGHQVLDASQDPLGDPADTYNGHQVLDASQDPYGDPADEEPQPAGKRGGWPF